MPGPGPKRRAGTPWPTRAPGLGPHAAGACPPQGPGTREPPCAGTDNQAGRPERSPSTRGSPPPSHAPCAKAHQTGRGRVDERSSRESRAGMLVVAPSGVNGRRSPSVAGGNAGRAGGASSLLFLAGARFSQGSQSTELGPRPRPLRTPLPGRRGVSALVPGECWSSPW
ncbi:hypothetical protein NDU88_004772 [Pleurodeles waltl]|uniref:Uncharacterized protein n=1 Tax=Pleurodeles waltl TaxID=8319 RepID=A0AAV7NKJ0_PLEWA|nr:hypothetical protein NDU88_004772 [Pleurodeles waltl]